MPDRTPGMGFGIVGTGLISDWFVAACREAGGTPVAICSRDARRGADFASTHSLTTAVTSVDALAYLDDVDAVYVASPIAAHRDQVAVALEHGKHVLCEKTLATSVDEVRGLFDQADRERRVLLEAVRPTHDPAYDIIRGALPRLGRLRHAHVEKCQYSSRYPSYLAGESPYAFDPASGNSALRDIGVYCIHPSLELFGRPRRWSRTGYRLENGFEAGGSTLLDYGSLSVTCTYSKVTNSVAPNVIHGEEGSLTIDSIAEPAQVRFIALDGTSESVLSGPPKRAQDTLRHEIARFMTLCAEGDVHHRYRENSLLAEQIMSGAGGAES